MIIPFDKFGKQEPPILTLYNYSEPIYSLGAYNVRTTLRFGAISELEFDYPQKISPTEHKEKASSLQRASGKKDYKSRKHRIFCYF